MAIEVYEVPESLDELFEDMISNKGEVTYRIVNYGEGMSMDNNESMSHFLEVVDTGKVEVTDNYGTQIVLQHPNYERKVVIDAGGLGDFFSHAFYCSWEEEDLTSTIMKLKEKNKEKKLSKETNGLTKFSLISLLRFLHLRKVSYM